MIIQGKRFYTASDIHQIISSACGVNISSIGLDTVIPGDELVSLQIALDLTDMYSVTITDADIRQWKTVKDIYETLFYS